MKNKAAAFCKFADETISRQAFTYTDLRAAFHAGWDAKKAQKKVAKPRKTGKV